MEVTLDQRGLTARMCLLIDVFEYRDPRQIVARSDRAGVDHIDIIVSGHKGAWRCTYRHRILSEDQVQGCRSQIKEEVTESWGKNDWGLDAHEVDSNLHQIRQ